MAAKRTIGEPTPPPTAPSDAVTHERFNLHANLTISESDDLGRERLCRYLTRPAFSLARIALRRDGTVSYRVKKHGRRKATHRVMTPVEFLARLSSLIPPPRYPLLRFHGVVAPRHKLRARVVPAPPAPMPTRLPRMEKSETAKPANPRRIAPTPEAHAAHETTGDGRTAFVIPEPALPASEFVRDSSVAQRVGPNVLSVAHWDRLLGGELYARSSRPDWATLLRRTFPVDVSVCPKCGGNLTVRAIVTEDATIAKILGALRRQARAPPSAAE
jgi:hypothetical protein